MRIIPFEPEHVLTMQLQPRQHRAISLNTLPYVTALKLAGPAASAEEDGRIVACGGIAKLAYGIGVLWVYVSPSIVRHAVRLDRALQKLIASANHRRIEATTESDWQESCRWLEHLGFQREGILRKYGHEGKDHVMYSRVDP